MSTPLQTSAHPNAGPESGPRTQDAAPTLSHLVDAYMNVYAGRDRTRAACLERWVKALGDRPFAAITDEELFFALEEIRKEPVRRFVRRDEFGRRQYIERPKRRSPATVNRYQAAIAAVFTWARKRRLAPPGWDNPARRLERAPERNAVVRFLSQAELARLLEACRGAKWPRLYLLVVMALTTGARKGELLALTWGDLELERAIAHVRETKNGHPRALPLTPAVLEELARTRLAREQPGHRLFASRGLLTRARAFESSWRAALERAKIERFRFHDLRHSCASYLAQNGASLLEIADVMGHRQLAMVKRYAHLTTDTKARLVNRVLGGIK